MEGIGGQIKRLMVGDSVVLILYIYYVDHFIVRFIFLGLMYFTNYGIRCELMP